jgi:CheY-like chemotaxis protein
MHLDVGACMNVNSEEVRHTVYDAQAAARPVVLVVEDEALLRMMAVELIEEAGLEAVEAPDADAALAILEARQDIRVLFTDVRMPGTMDGLMLARTVRNRWPPIKIVVTSGHCSSEEAGLAPDNIFVAKPYESSKLAGTLRQLMG